MSRHSKYGKYERAGDLPQSFITDEERKMGWDKPINPHVDKVCGVKGVRDEYGPKGYKTGQVVTGNRRR